MVAGSRAVARHRSVPDLPSLVKTYTFDEPYPSARYTYLQKAMQRTMGTVH